MRREIAQNVASRNIFAARQNRASTGGVYSTHAVKKQLL
jgi:hypothetical protein